MPPELTIAETHSTASAAALRSRKWKRARNLMSIFFLVTLTVPLLGARFHWDPIESSENRVLARLPGVPQNFKDMSHFADGFLAYYKDHFGFRNTLIHGLKLAQYSSGLGIDQATGIIVGKNGWLFFPSESHNFLADRYLDPFTSADLDAWQRMLEQRTKFCADHGIKFIAVIPPDKQSIYGEMLPDDFTRLGPHSRLDQLIARLHETHSSVDVVDLRPPLLAAKRFNRLYHKTDTHWNDYGAFAAYPAIIDAVNRELPGAHLVPQPTSEFIPRSTPHSGDLARYMNLYYEYNEDWLQLVRRTPFPPIVTPENPYIPITTQGTDSHAPALYMIHDSFTLSLAQFVGPNFSRVCWQWTTVLNSSLVLPFKPDVVVDEFLERTLYLPVPQDTADVRAVEPR